jgi:hypothetical protein
LKTLSKGNTANLTSPPWKPSFCSLTSSVKTSAYRLVSTTGSQGHSGVLRPHAGDPLVIGRTIYEHDVNEIQLIIENPIDLNSKAKRHQIEHLYTRCFEQEIKNLTN